ncbi:MULTISPECIES: flagellar biosynthetic protein FliO [Shewanella]|jgi:flagellar protein FliO/FliZ|uniref:Flagellar protein n=1 Tax=Shewanella metallivivens TaxID=2872342 RepID=A0ABT5TJ15_9GAMM|nr:flagellar biosynthetic protein FliO [Shewanella metallivivens]MDD8058601.1 flagellar biosynthetic protein FliO [Shewanella metallivivens]
MISMLSVMAQALTDVDAANSTTTAVLTRTSEASNTATLANMVGGLIVVLALIFVLAYIVKRLNLVPSNGGVIKSLAVTPIGQREKVVLIEVNGQQYLLGVTSQQISLIDKLDTQVDVQTSSFANRLKQAKEQQ